jgi:hypothetical protein
MANMHPQDDLRLAAIAAERPLADEQSHQEPAIEVGQVAHVARF